MLIVLIPAFFFVLLLAGLFKMPATRPFLPMRIFLSASAVVVLVCLVLLVIAIRRGMLA